MCSHIQQSWPKRLFRMRDGLGRINRSRTGRDSRFGLEPLEERLVLSNYIVTNVNYSGTGSLGAAIAAAVTSDDSHAQIDFGLPANSTISVIGSDQDASSTYGPTAYVVSGSGVNITIDGSGAPGLTINGSGAIRVFAVTSTASLTLDDLTVSGGLAQGFAGGVSNNGGEGGGGGVGRRGVRRRRFVHGGGSHVHQRPGHWRSRRRWRPQLRKRRRRRRWRRPEWCRPGRGCPAGRVGSMAAVRADKAPTAVPAASAAAAAAASANLASTASSAARAASAAVVVVAASCPAAVAPAASAVARRQRRRGFRVRGPLEEMVPASVAASSATAVHSRSSTTPSPATPRPEETMATSITQAPRAADMAAAHLRRQRIAECHF